MNTNTSTTPTPTRRGESVAQAVIMLAVAGMAGAASFTHVHDWTMHNSPAGTGSWFGWANAVISELTPTAAGLEIRRRKRQHRPIAYPMTVLIAAATLSLAAQVAFLLLGAGMLSARIASIAIHEEVRDRRTPFSAWLRTGWFWSVAVSLTGVGLILVWPSALELWKTGKTYVHWSRFVVAMGCFGSVALFSVIRGLDRLLDLVEARVQHLWAK